MYKPEICLDTPKMTLFKATVQTHISGILRVDSEELGEPIFRRRARARRAPHVFFHPTANGFSLSLMRHRVAFQLLWAL
jgi:hypothetical protein